MVTVKEIARECKVSPTTVSNILNGKPKVSEETRQRVLEAVDKMGYRPNYIAQGLRNRKTKTIGIIAEDIAQFSTPEILDGIMSCCEEKGYRVVVKNLRLYARWSDSWFDNEIRYHSILDPTLKELESIRVDGIIYIAGHARIVHCFPEGFHTPAVMAYAFSDNKRVPSVAIEDQESACEMIRYLMSKGHSRIGVIAGKENNIHTQQRVLGYRKILRENNIPFHPAWVRYTDWEKAGAYLEAKELLKEDVTAIFCLADQMAGGVYLRLDEMGLRAGRDIAVAGFDNQDIAEFFVPGLTTMALPLREIGSVSADYLLRQMDGTEGEIPEKTLIPCTFIERESVHEI